MSWTVLNTLNMKKKKPLMCLLKCFLPTELFHHQNGMKMKKRKVFR